MSEKKNERIMFESILIGYGTVARFEMSKETANSIIKEKIKRGFELVLGTKNKKVFSKDYIVYIFEKQEDKEK